MDSNMLKSEIKKRLELTSCPVHHEHPSVSVTDTGISIKGCCDEFQKQTAQYARTVANDIRDEIENDLRGIIG